MDRATWESSRSDEMACVEAFTDLMRGELAANAHKGDRPGWLSMNGREAVGELLYHAAKLAYAARQHEQGEGSELKVMEFAADTANCALMVADCVNCLPVPKAGRGDE